MEHLIIVVSSDSLIPNRPQVPQVPQPVPVPQHPVPVPVPQPVPQPVPVPVQPQPQAQPVGSQCGVGGNVLRTKPDVIITRIHGGWPADRHEWPWIARIIGPAPKFGNFHCGGSLVGPKHILTAAHCVDQ